MEKDITWKWLSLISSKPLHPLRTTENSSHTQRYHITMSSSNINSSTHTKRHCSLIQYDLSHYRTSLGFRIDCYFITWTVCMYLFYLFLLWFNCTFLSYSAIQLYYCKHDNKSSSFFFFSASFLLSLHHNTTHHLYLNVLIKKLIIQLVNTYLGIIMTNT